MPLSENEIPVRGVHRFCVRCRKWHEASEGRYYVLPRVRHMAIEAGRALAGIEEPVRFMCHSCARRRVRMRLWLLGGLLLLLAIALIVRLVLRA